MGVKDQKITDRYSFYNGDCIEVMGGLPNESIDHAIYSPPFAELYNYSSSDEDLSNCKSYEEFLVHYRYVVEHVYRLLRPGRLTVVHCMDLRYNSRRARDFPGDIIRMHEDVGFHYRGRHTIWKNPLKQAIRTRCLHLRHGQLVKDSSICGVAGGDYIVVLAKPGENERAIDHPSGLSRYAGEDQPPVSLVQKYAGHEDSSTNKLSHYIWQRYASSVWMDIRAGRVLKYREARESDEEKHICPLQLDVIERCLTLYTNPDDIVLTPFLGVGSEAYCAVEYGRRAIGIELKPSYYRQAVANMEGVNSNSAFQGDDLFSLGQDA